MNTSSTDSIEEHRDVIFKTHESTNLVVDLFLPKSDAVHPGVLVAHGGGWTLRSGTMEGICRRLARQGFAAINVTYRLAPKHVFPAPVEDVREAVKWVREHASEYRIEAHRLSAWGYSAGGNLILLAGLDPALGLKSLIAGGAPTDLTVWPNSFLVKRFLGKPYAENQELWRQASPVYSVRFDSPPVFLYHGSSDWIVDPDQFARMKKVLQEHKVTHEAYLVPRAGHVIAYFAFGQTFSRAVDFLKRTL